MYKDLSEKDKQISDEHWAKQLALRKQYAEYVMSEYDLLSKWERDYFKNAND